MTSTKSFYGPSSPRARAVVEVLKRHGPITARALAAKIDMDIVFVSGMVYYIRSKIPGFIRIAGYECNIAEYEWSGEPDIERPKLLRQLGWTQRYRESLVPPRPKIPAAPMSPLAWLTTQPPAQMSARW